MSTLRLQLPDRRHIRRVDHSDPLPYYYVPLLSHLFRQRLQMALDLLGPGPFETLLEVGYGSGILLPTLAARARRVVALDLHRRAGLVQAMLLAERVQAALVDGDVRALSFADGSFDAAVCISTLEHLKPDELRVTIGEFKRVLRPGGIAVIGIPASGWLMDLLFCSIGFAEIGEHHVSTRHDVEAELHRQMTVESVRRLAPFGMRPAALYTVYRCRSATPLVVVR